MQSYLLRRGALVVPIFSALVACAAPSTNDDGAESGQPFPFAAEDMFSAQGVGPNLIDVIPSTKTMIVHIRPLDWVNPSAMLADGKQDLHRDILRRVLDADSRGD